VAAFSTHGVFSSTESFAHAALQSFNDLPCPCSAAHTLFPLIELCFCPAADGSLEMGQEKKPVG